MIAAHPLPQFLETLFSTTVYVKYQHRVTPGVGVGSAGVGVSVGVGDGETVTEGVGEGVPSTGRVIVGRGTVGQAGVRVGRGVGVQTGRAQHEASPGAQVIGQVPGVGDGEGEGERVSNIQGGIVGVGGGPPGVQVGVGLCA